MMKKRLAALLLCLAMVLTMAPVGVLAEDGSGSGGNDTEVAEIIRETSDGPITNTYTDWSDAFSDWCSGGTLKLKEDLVATGTDLSDLSQDIVLDTNGHSLTVSCIYLFASLTVKGSGSLTCAISNDNVNITQTLTVSGATVNCTSSQAEATGGPAYALQGLAKNIVVENNGTLNLNGSAYFCGDLHLVLRDGGRFCISRDQEIKGYDTNSLITQFGYYLPSGVSVSQGEDGIVFSGTDDPVTLTDHRMEHTVTVQNGTPATIQAKVNDVVSIQAAESEGCFFKKWSYDPDNELSWIAVDAAAGPEYVENASFYMPDCDVTVSAVYDHLKDTINQVEAKAATCTEDGHIAYFQCEKCGKYFSDADCTNEITQEETVIPATGHTWNVRWNWAEDYSTASATFTCSKDTSHTEQIVASNTDITYADDPEATCTGAGTRRYTAVVTLDGKEYTNTNEETETVGALGHAWGEPTYEWAADNSTVTATRVCSRDSTHVETEAVDTTSEVTTPATCEAKGKTTYTASFANSAFATQTKTLEKVDALSHDWGTPTYEWAADNSRVTATRTCKNDESHVETETVNTTSEVTTPATCETKGKTTYTATFTNTAFATQAKTLENVDAMGHDWNPATYEWASDNSSVTATRTCKHDSTHVQTETANATSEVKKAATCKEQGTRKFTSAAFENGAFAAQTKEVDIAIDADAHDWGTPTYGWASDNSSVTATRTCKNDATHVETETVGTTYTVTKAATCEEEGTWTYSSKAFENQAFTQQLNHPVSVDAVGHKWGEPTWFWSDDYSEATAKFICANNSEHTESVQGSVSSQVKTEATCTSEGSEEHIATVTFNGKEYLETKTQVLSKLAHNLTTHAAVPATCTEAGNIAYWTCSECKKLFSDESCATEVTEDQTVVAKIAHTLTRQEAVEATCTAAGNIEYWTCSACNKYFSDAEGKTEIAQADTVTAKIAHTLTAHAAVPATCTEAGNSAYWSCSKCGKYFSDANGETEVNKDSWTIPSTEHKNLTKKAEEKPATCEEDGNIAYWYCPDCGRYFSDAEATEVIAGDSWIIEALGHQMEQVPAKAHTCTEDGVIGHYRCTRCDGRFSDSAGKEPLQDNSWVDPAGHDLTHVAAVEPTCAEAGTKEHWHCAVCVKNFSDEEGKTELDDVTIPTVSHTLERVYAHAPCTEPGNSAYWKCTACGRLYTDQAATKETTIEEVTIPATGSHDTQNMSKIDAQEATCTEAGNVEYWYCGNCQKDYDASGNEITDLSTVVVMSLGHQWSVTWKWSGYTGATASFVCGRDSSHTESLVASQTDITSEVTTPATCTAVGVRTYTAKVTLDGTAYTDTATETLSLAAHTLTETKAKEATCTEPGNSTYWTCSVCGKYFSDAGGNTEIENNSWIINATDHEWGTPAYDWAEDYSKVTAYRVCVNDASHKQTETVDTVSNVTKAATCEVKGETTYTAAFTNTAFTEQTKTVANIDAMGHTWGDTPVWKWDGYTAATATFTCTVDGCGGTNPVTATITDEVTKNPTCVTDGERTYTAKVTLDGEEYTDSKTEVISATGHSWNEPTYEWSADNSKVKAIRTCANDSGEYESQEVETTMETTPATCSATGKTTYTATFSDEAFATQTKEVTLSIDSENHDWENTDWVWADDYSSAKVIFACRHNSSHTASVEVSGDDITVERTEPTCTEAGEAVYRGSVTYGNATANAENHVELEATGHATPNGWKHDENAHWQECPNCGQVLGESAAHAWDDGVTASGGKTVYTCTVCGDQKAEEQPTLAQRIEKGLQKLLAGIRYSFGSGTHTVSGDTTVYAGDQEFYVRVEGEYTVN